MDSARHMSSPSPTSPFLFHHSERCKSASLTPLLSSTAEVTSADDYFTTAATIGSFIQGDHGNGTRHNDHCIDQDSLNGVDDAVDRMHNILSGGSSASSVVSGTHLLTGENHSQHHFSRISLEEYCDSPLGLVGDCVGSLEISPTTTACVTHMNNNVNYKVNGIRIDNLVNCDDDTVDNCAESRHTTGSLSPTLLTTPVSSLMSSLSQSSQWNHHLHLSHPSNSQGPSKPSSEPPSLDGVSQTLQESRDLLSCVSLDRPSSEPPAMSKEAQSNPLSHVSISLDTVQGCTTNEANICGKISSSAPRMNAPRRPRHRQARRIAVRSRSFQSPTPSKSHSQLHLQLKHHKKLQELQARLFGPSASKESSDVSSSEVISSQTESGEEIDSSIDFEVKLESPITNKFADQMVNRSAIRINQSRPIIQPEESGMENLTTFLPKIEFVNKQSLPQEQQQQSSSNSEISRFKTIVRSRARRVSVHPRSRKRGDCVTIKDEVVATSSSSTIKVESCTTSSDKGGINNNSDTSFSTGQNDSSVSTISGATASGSSGPLQLNTVVSQSTFIPTSTSVFNLNSTSSSKSSASSSSPSTTSVSEPIFVAPISKPQQKSSNLILSPSNNGNMSSTTSVSSNNDTNYIVATKSCIRNNSQNQIVKALVPNNDISGKETLIFANITASNTPSGVNNVINASHQSNGTSSLAALQQQHSLSGRQIAIQVICQDGTSLVLPVSSAPGLAESLAAAGQLNINSPHFSPVGPLPPINSASPATGGLGVSIKNASRGKDQDSHNITTQSNTNSTSSTGITAPVSQQSQQPMQIHSALAASSPTLAALLDGNHSLSDHHHRERDPRKNTTLNPGLSSIKNFATKEPPASRKNGSFPSSIVSLTTAGGSLSSISNAAIGVTTSYSIQASKTNMASSNSASVPSQSNNIVDSAVPAFNSSTIIAGDLLIRAHTQQDDICQLIEDDQRSASSSSQANLNTSNGRNDGGQLNDSITANSNGEHNQPFRCEHCNSTFTRLGNFTRHKKIHTMPP
ncbi:hypothetical protein GZH46_00595, partial [Fragariocoptes setiger]